MQLRINGEVKEVRDGLTVEGLLSFLEIKTPRVAVEVNATVITRARHAETPLRAGDEVEIVTFVGGG
ncbi:MAG: sulfur carrier protein ThiS [Archangium sp.]|nr:sulfur carrier protein ThiS [Archangium sp.]